MIGNSDEFILKAIQSTDEAIEALRASRATLRAALSKPVDAPAAVNADDLLSDLTSLEQQLDQLIALDDERARHHDGVVVHGKLRRAKREFDQLPAGDTTDLVRIKLRAISDRLLRDVFGVDGDAEAV